MTQNKTPWGLLRRRFHQVVAEVAKPLGSLFGIAYDIDGPNLASA